MDKVTTPTLFKKGAEASLHIATWNGRQAIFKTRFPKRYRHETLDEDIRKYRTTHEPQLMNEAKKAGVPTPVVFQVDIGNSTIAMEFIQGMQAKQLLDKLSPEERKEMCTKIGENIGKLHKHGVIHGDLTTSNMIIDRKGTIYLVDFGLGEKNTELEAKGVDLHLMKRALQSTHYQFAEECFEAISNGYSTIVGEDRTREVAWKIKEIERRGRYVEERREEQQNQN
jgi:TP53 regulating kinase-like protein